MAMDPESSTIKKRNGNMAQLVCTAFIRPDGNPLDLRNRVIASTSIVGPEGGIGGAPNAGGGMGTACAIGTPDCMI